MLQSIADLQGYTICAIDGEIGFVDHFLFDDQTWQARYLVVCIGGWLLGRYVLLTPDLLGTVSADLRMMEVALTQQQVKQCPDETIDPPVSRQFNVAMLQDSDSQLGWDMLPIPWFRRRSAYTPSHYEPRDDCGDQPGISQTKIACGDPHLRSTRELCGYHIQARDGTFGQITDFLINDTAWTIRFVVVDTGTWRPGKQVLLPGQRICGIQWLTSMVQVDLPCATLERHPNR